MKKLLVIILFASATVRCSSENDFEKGKSQLLAMGYTDIENTGYDIWCCSEDDDFSTGFKAKDRMGNTVKGCFCSSLLKGITVRWK